jgi:exopolyphosphatase/guanosine-5'-triphosphate,3'-diphosphate pyrophosphatase
MRVCTVDIGTNSVRGLVAEVGESGCLEVVHREGRITRLGEELSEEGILGELAMERTANAVERIVAEARRLGAVRFKLVATSAARNAANAESLTERIRRTTALDMEIISGVEEAKYVCRGAVGSLELAHERVLLVDIGGGSTELISVGGGEEPELRSVRVGAVYVTEKHIRHDPPLDEEMAAAVGGAGAALRETLSGLPGEAEELIGLGGTVTTIPPILMEMETYDASRVHNYVVTMEEAESVLRRLAALPLQERKKVIGLEPGRADIIVGGLLILKALLTASGFEKVRVSDRGILFGLAWSLLSEGS